MGAYLAGLFESRVCPATMLEVCLKVRLLMVQLLLLMMKKAGHVFEDSRHAGAKLDACIFKRRAHHHDAKGRHIVRCK